MFHFSLTDTRIFYMPGIWAHAGTADGPIDSYALITTAPGEDAAEYHHRQPVILRKERLAAWLDLSTSREELVEMFDAPWPKGSITAERVLL